MNRIASLVFFFSIATAISCVRSPYLEMPDQKMKMKEFY
jgi:hypothetical protein